MRKCVLGIDTSNYTTSVSIVDEQLNLVANIKYPLPVKEGERGLRQSDAVFAHIKNLPFAFEDVKKVLAVNDLVVVAIGVSKRPRNQNDSYMPCFLAGVNAAISASSVGNSPLYYWSHQCGHIMAAAYGADAMHLLEKPFLAFHVSGGTTEMVRAELTDEGFCADIVGGSKDLHAGQVIDRIGVAMGLPFPAGVHMERLALNNTQKIPRKKPATEGCYIHLSGLENLALKLYGETNNKELVAAFVFDHIGHGLEYMAQAFFEAHGQMPVIMGGGVMSNSILKQRMSKKFGAYIAPPALSADNAVGIAVLTAKKVF